MIRNVPYLQNIHDNCLSEIMYQLNKSQAGNFCVTELHKLFDWAESSNKGMILFIDEADAFLRKGRGDQHAMSENMRNALSAFLFRTGTETDKFMIVLATNIPGKHCCSFIEKNKPYQRTFYVSERGKKSIIFQKIFGFQDTSFCGNFFQENKSLKNYLFPQEKQRNVAGKINLKNRIFLFFKKKLFLNSLWSTLSSFLQKTNIFVLKVSILIHGMNKCIN